MSTLERAIEIAVKAHAGQIDKAGEPYILHPLRLMFAVNGMYTRMVAVLHDVVEDTSVTIDNLKAEGFPAEVIEAVQALTKQKGESRIEAAKRASANSISRAVKLADVTDNMDITRISQPTEKDYLRLKEYEKVRALLLSHGTI